MSAGMCGDCAFRPNSPEREPYSGGLEAEGGSLIDLLEQRLRTYREETKPFFCHVGATCSKRDGWRYVLSVPEGVELRVCAGWLATRERILNGGQGGSAVS